MHFNFTRHGAFRDADEGISDDYADIRKGIENTGVRLDHVVLSRDSHIPIVQLDALVEERAQRSQVARVPRFKVLVDLRGEDDVRSGELSVG